jgi:hypothetical protein
MAKYNEDDYSPAKTFRYGSNWVDDDNEWHGEYTKDDEEEFKPFKRKFEDIYEDSTADYDYTKNIDHEFTETVPRAMHDRIYHPVDPLKNRIIYIVGIATYALWLIIKIVLLIIYR